jgi:hypothetical protein
MPAPSQYCRTLQEAGRLTAKSKVFQGCTQELQAEINQELLERMHEDELEVLQFLRRSI